MQNYDNNGRLKALDILRGITIAGMLLVNNPGSWGAIYAPLTHAEWNGLTPTDLVFPFFMFIMGVSTCMSLRKYDFRLSAAALWKVVRRTVVIFAIGLGVAWLGLSARGVYNGAALWDAVTDFDHLRILGVMPRLAICYGVAALMALLLKPRALKATVVVMLCLYAVLLLAGRGYEFSTDNIISRIDHSILGPDHMYADTVDGRTLKFDPEGILSTLPSVAHVLIGLLCGMLLLRQPDNYRRSNQLFVVGACLTFTGFLLSYGLPINKKIWSPTFVLTTCGMAATLLGLLITVIDIKGHSRWCRFFEAFGVNPLFMYVFGTVLAIALGAIPCGDTSVKGFLYRDVLMPLTGGKTPELASLLYAVLFITIVWLVGLVLYKKKIYIKI